MEEATRYLAEIQTALIDIKQQNMSEDDRKLASDILLFNALKEFSSDPVSILCDPENSRAFQTLLDDSSCESILSFLKEISKQLYEICSNPFGSHVCEHLLISISDTCHTPNAQKVLDDIYSALCGSLSDFIFNKFATYIIRRILSLLSGIDTTKIVKESNAKQMGISNVDMNTMLQRERVERPRFFKNLIIRLTEFFMEMLQEDVEIPMQVICSPVSSPTLQVLLIAISSQSRSKLKKLIRMLLCKQNQTFGLDDKKVLRCMRGKCSSHFMEVLLRVAPQSVLRDLSEICLSGNIPSLCTHPYANFPLQTIITATSSSKQVACFSNALGPHFGEIISKNCTGVILAVMKKILEVGGNQEQGCSYLVAALKSLQRNEIYGVCELLFCHGTHAKLGENYHRLSHKGCMLLETMLHYSQESIQPFLLSLKSLSKACIHHIASDSCGSRVLEQLLKNEEISVHFKKTVLDNLKGQWTQMAMSSSGSHLLEACFDFAKLQTKTEMLQNLQTNRVEICKTVWGAAALRHCESQKLQKPEKPESSKRPSVAREMSMEKKSKRHKKNKAMGFVAPSYTAHRLQ